MKDKFNTGEVLTSEKLNKGIVKYICPEDFQVYNNGEAVESWSDCIVEALKYAIANNIEFKCENGIYVLDKPIIINSEEIETGIETYTKRIEFNCELQASSNFGVLEGLDEMQETEGMGEEELDEVRRHNIDLQNLRKYNNYLVVFNPTSFGTEQGEPKNRIRYQNFYFKKLNTINEDDKEVGGILIQPITKELQYGNFYTSEDDTTYYPRNNLSGFSFSDIQMDIYNGMGPALELDATYGIITTSTFRGIRWESQKAQSVIMKIDEVTKTKQQIVEGQTKDINIFLNRNTFLTSINFYDVEFFTGNKEQVVDIGKENTVSSDFSLHRRFTVTTDTSTGKKTYLAPYRAITAYTVAPVRSTSYGCMHEIHYSLTNVNLESAGGIYHRNNVVQCSLFNCRLIEQQAKPGWLYLDYGVLPARENFNRNIINITNTLNDITSTNITFNFADNFMRYLGIPVVYVYGLLNGNPSGGVIDTAGHVKLNNPEEMVRVTSTNLLDYFSWKNNIIYNASVETRYSGIQLKNKYCWNSFILTQSAMTKIKEYIDSKGNNQSKYYIILPESNGMNLYKQPLKCLVEPLSEELAGADGRITLVLGKEHLSFEIDNNITTNITTKIIESSNKNFQSFSLAPEQKYLIDFQIYSGIVESDINKTLSYGQTQALSMR